MADLTVEEQKKQDAERRRLLLALLLLLATDTHEHLTKQTTAYLSGTSSSHALRSGTAVTLLGAHTHAVWLGRRLAGVSHPIDEQDQQFAQAVMAGQASFLANLTNDMATGRYPLVDGAISPALSHRLLQWAHRLRGTANEAWGRAQSKGTRFFWNLGAVERHCAECPEREAASPFTIETIPGWPGDCSTPCLDNCDCTVRTEHGQEGFALFADSQA